MKVASVIKPNTSFRTPDDIAMKNRLKYPVLQRGCSHVHKSKNGSRFCEAGTESEKFRDTEQSVLGEVVWWKAAMARLICDSGWRKTCGNGQEGEQPWSIASVFPSYRTRCKSMRMQTNVSVHSGLAKWQHSHGVCKG